MNAPLSQGGPSAAPEEPGFDDEQIEAFNEAHRLQEEKTLGTHFARKCLSICLILGAGLTVSVVLNGFQFWHSLHLDNKYYSTQDGRITRIYPLNRPAWSVEDVSKFGADTIQQSFTMDFVHFRNQMTSVMPRYSDEGYAGYYKALTSSNVLAMVRDKRMNLSVTVSPGVVHSKGELNGVYLWKIQYPVTMQLDGQQTSMPPQRYIVELLIQQADPREKPLGLETRQTIMMNGN
ncbi:MULTISPECIES: DotI/IcmL/TraM family protein [Rosenbergiella]|uniref:DotI/IcmL/TraM family protein n=1 Tax=Rosenbergiella TaxID=1356488 RepID=UPI001F503921|nr:MULTISPECIES: DotI/IcmL/TraM family protein [Rosenbergiella]